MTVKFKHLQLTRGSDDSDVHPYLQQLVKLSLDWDNEGTCPSYSANAADDFCGRDLFVALLDKQIIAYAMGDVKTLQEATSYNQIGEKAFELDELYVIPSYRRQGIGGQLYSYLEHALLDRIDLIGVIATSYKYPELLSFYINDLGMMFNHALLTKRLKK